MNLQFDGSIDRTPILGLELYTLAPAANLITPPVALTTVTEKVTSEATQRNGKPFSFGIGEDIELYVSYLGVNEEGKPCNSVPSPVLTYTTLAAGEALVVTLPTVAGISGYQVFMKTETMPEPLLAAVVPANAGKAIIDRQPISDAFSLAKATALGQALYTLSAYDAPAFLKSPTIEFTNGLIEREYFNSSGTKHINSSMLMITGEFPPTDVRLEQLITGGGRYTQDGTTIQGGSGYIAGACQYPLWSKFTRSANSCGARQHNLMLATFATDTTPINQEGGNIQFTLTQQHFPQFKGVEPIPWVIL